MKVYIATTSVSDGTMLSGETTSSVNLSSNPVETSDKSSLWQKYIAGLRGGTADVTIYADNADAPQSSLLAKFVSGDTLLAFIGQMTGSGSVLTPSEGISFTAIISTISDTYDNGSVCSRAVTLQISGEPTFYPTPA
jgi:hypothetical protein